MRIRPSTKKQTRKSQKPTQTRFHGIAKTTRVFNPLQRTTAASRQRRPIVTNESMQIILRSDLARGRMSLRKHDRKIATLMKTLAARHGVRIFKFANVGNHIHVHLQVTKRLHWKGFISGLTGGIARAVGFRRVDRPFWNARPFSRVISWGREFAMITDYLKLNELEATGAIPPRKQMRKGAKWRRIVQLMSDDDEDL